MGWYVLKDRRHVGPYTKEDLATLHRRGHIQPQDYVISDVDVAEGELKYKSLSEVLPHVATKAKAAEKSESNFVQSENAADEHDDRPLGTFSEEELLSNEMSRVFSEAVESIDLVKGATNKTGGSSSQVPSAVEAFPKATVFEDESLMSKLRGSWPQLSGVALFLLLLVGAWKFNAVGMVKSFTAKIHSSHGTSSVAGSLVVQKAARPVVNAPRPAISVAPAHPVTHHTIRVPAVHQQPVVERRPEPEPPRAEPAFVPPPPEDAREPASNERVDPDDRAYADEEGAPYDDGEPAGDVSSRPQRRRRGNSVPRPARDPDSYEDSADYGNEGSPAAGPLMGPGADEQPVQDEER